MSLVASQTSRVSAVRTRRALLRADSTSDSTAWVRDDGDLVVGNDVHFVSQGDLVVDGTISAEGDVDFESGANLTVNGDVQAEGDIDISSALDTVINGTVTQAGTVRVIESAAAIAARE